MSGCSKVKYILSRNIENIFCFVFSRVKYVSKRLRQINGGGVFWQLK